MRTRIDLKDSVGKTVEALIQAHSSFGPRQWTLVFTDETYSVIGMDHGYDPWDYSLQDEDMVE